MSSSTVKSAFLIPLLLNMCSWVLWTAGVEDCYVWFCSIQDIEDADFIFFSVFACDKLVVDLLMSISLNSRVPSLFHFIELPRSTLQTHWSGDGISSQNHQFLVPGVGFLLRLFSKGLKVPTDVDHLYWGACLSLPKSQAFQNTFLLDLCRLSSAIYYWVVSLS